MLQLTYKYGVDMDEVYSDLKNSMDNLMPTLPEDCEDPLIMELSADFMPTMILSAVAPEGMDAAQLPQRHSGASDRELGRRGPGGGHRGPGRVSAHRTG